MTDLRQRLSELDRLEAPEMRTKIDRRAEELRQAAPETLVAGAWVPVRQGVLIAVGTAVAILVVVAAAMMILQANRNEAPVIDQPAPTTTVPESEISKQAAVTLVPAPGIDPVRVSTVLGDIDFVTMKSPRGQAFDLSYPRLAATPYGPVAVTVDGALWSSADYQTWQPIPIDLDADGVALVGDDVVVSRMRSMTRLGWDGDRWRVVERVELPGLGGIDYLAFGPRGVVAANRSIIYFSPDGTSFARAERGPDFGIFVASDENPEEAEFVEAARNDCRGTFGATRSVIRAVVATDAGFVAFTSATNPVSDEVCAPLLWFSTDGNVWDLVSPVSPFGELAAVSIHSIAERAGRFVAIGGVEAEMQGFVWVSDDALTWQQADVAIERPFIVDAGEPGWVLTGAAIENDFALWFSTDGFTWDGPHPLPEGLIAGYGLPEIAVGSDTILASGPDEEIFVIGSLAEGSD
jgi:hypothetical protein